MGNKPNLDMLNAHEQKIVKKIGKFMIFVTLDDIIQHVEKYVKNLDDNCKILVSGYRWSSNHIIAAKLIEKKIIDINSIIFSNDCEGIHVKKLLIVDDVLFTGKHTVNLLLSFLKNGGKYSNAVVITAYTDLLALLFVAQTTGAFVIPGQQIPTMKSIFPNVDNWTDFNNAMEKLTDKKELPEKFQELLEDKSKLINNYGLFCTNYSFPNPYSGLPTVCKLYFKLDESIRELSKQSELYKLFLNKLGK